MGNEDMEVSKKLVFLKSHKSFAYDVMKLVFDAGIFFIFSEQNWKAGKLWDFFCSFLLHKINMKGWNFFFVNFQYLFGKKVTDAFCDCESF